mmetsp:Transcript_22335/g.88666  ORF Transcript_22335/g.88666 Transcript_22335/m.88666 type:complete len:97 (-) Transcript_22335:2275-2565(-)
MEHKHSVGCLRQTKAPYRESSVANMQVVHICVNLWMASWQQEFLCMFVKSECIIEFTESFIEVPIVVDKFSRSWMAMKCTTKNGGCPHGVTSIHQK